jgi:hypothetical protein
MESRDSTRASRAADCEETIDAYIIQTISTGGSYKEPPVEMISTGDSLSQSLVLIQCFHRLFLKPVANVIHCFH